MSTLRRFGLALAIGGGLGAGAFGAEPVPEFADPALAARYEALNRELRCMVCQNQSIADSNATLAADLRREVREQLERGATDEEIVAFMTARYGNYVMYRPPFGATTVLLWTGPFLLLAIALGVWWRVLRQRARASVDEVSR
jgi:cytochrome c-type biogenesis protein CcmH